MASRYISGNEQSAFYRALAAIESEQMAGGVHTITIDGGDHARAENVGVASLVALAHNAADSRHVNGVRLTHPGGDHEVSLVTFTVHNGHDEQLVGGMKSALKRMQRDAVHWLDNSTTLLRTARKGMVSYHAVPFPDRESAIAGRALLSALAYAHGEVDACQEQLESVEVQGSRCPAVLIRDDARETILRHERNRDVERLR